MTTSYRASRLRGRIATVVVVCLASATVPANAQRAYENVVRAADDAFGSVVGDEQIGLYSAGNVRGFSPFNAGNVRIEGLFIDIQGGFSSRLVSGSTIRAGLSAQGYLLPAPTGIADFSLRRVAEVPTQSAIIRLNDYLGYGAAADLQHRTHDGRLELAGGAGYNRFEFGDGTTDIFANAGGNLRWRPNDALDLTVFADLSRAVSDQLSPRYFPAGAFLPPRPPRRNFVGQEWVETGGDNYNLGVIASYAPGATQVRVGVFRSASEGFMQTGQFFTDVDREGIGDGLAVLGPASGSVADSLEVRASRIFRRQRLQHTVAASVRARERRQRFGGTQEIDLGRSTVFEREAVPRPEVTFGERARERVDQVTVGASYDLRWAGVGQLNLGLQQTRYSRLFRAPADEPLEGDSSPLLYNANGAVELRPWLVAYGGVVTGFEEAPTAPSIATNRNQAPPAIETRQADAGVRLLLGPLTAVAGVFTIRKPFFGLDGERRFDQQGVVTNRGIELSLAGGLTPQLQVVFGSLWLDATLTGTPVDEGLLSPNPVGVVRRTTTLDLDYRPARLPGWSFDAGVFSRGEENGDQLGRLRVPARTEVNLGWRRRWTLGDGSLVLRGRISNLLNNFGWSVSGNGAFVFSGPRAYSMSVRVDF